MRLVIYKILTQLIIWLGRMRARVVARGWHRRVKERVFDVYAVERWECCDCGLVHDFEAFEPGQKCDHKPLTDFPIIGHTWPVRPKDYDYRFRHGALNPSLAAKR